MLALVLALSLGQAPTLYDEGVAKGSVVRLNCVGAGINCYMDGGYATVGVAGGGGSGTVTSVAVTTANGVSGIVANSTTTPAITLTLSAITPSSVAASGTVSGSNLSGTNTGDQTKTCGAGEALTTLAAGTGSTCTAFASGFDGGPAATRTNPGTVTIAQQDFEGRKVFYADAGTNATSMNGVVVVVNTSDPATGSSNIAFANPEVSVSGATPTIGGFVGYNEQSVAPGTTGHMVLAAGVGRGVRLTTNGAVNVDCHGQACGIGGATGNPATATLQVADIGVAGINVAVTSGNNALAVGSNGGRIDHGAGANDYSSSDGTTVTYAGPLAASNLSGTNTGDQTETCTDQFVRTIAAGTGSTCAGVAIADHTATGTPSATTFLRGDNTWATPAGGSGISYAEAAAATLAGF